MHSKSAHAASEYILEILYKIIYIQRMLCFKLTVSLVYIFFLVRDSTFIYFENIYIS